eukprot:1139789-Pelagomonas_calceolata.AAC.1
MTHSRQQQQRGSRVGPVQQGLAGAGCQAACPGGPGITLQAPPLPKSSLPHMERQKMGMSRDQVPVLET